MTLQRIVAGLVAVLVVSALTLAATLRSQLAPADPGAEPVAFSVPAGQPLTAIARGLEDRGLVRNADVVIWLARWRGLAGELRSGEYRLSAASTPDEILARIAAGAVETWPVVLPEGFTAAQIGQRLEAAGLADAAAFDAVVRDPEGVRSLGLEGASLEGYLFPDTYRLARGLAPRAVAEAMVARFRNAWAEIEPLAANSGMSMLEIVTLASIVEKETGAPDERPLIASVFLNRLARGMRLETDPTVIYGIPDFDGNLKRRHLEDASNPYNTYQIRGLPPGPIASPGADALRAVVEPADTDFFYFVSRNDGTHKFSRSYREHTNAVNAYQRRRRR